MLKFSSNYYLILILFILSSCESDERILARVFVPIIVIVLLGLFLNPLAKKSKENRSNKLNEELKKIEEQNSTTNFESKDVNVIFNSEFQFIASSRKSTFILGCVFLILGLLLSIYTIFLLDTIWIFLFFLVSFLTWLSCRSLIVKETKAIIKLMEKQLELIIGENHELIRIFPQDISYLRIYEVHSSNKGMKQLHGKLIELKLNEEYLKTNQIEKLEKFKRLFCNSRPSINKATNPSFRLMNLTKEDVGILWNEYSFFSGNRPLKSADGRYFRKEILTFCVKNSVQILNELENDYTLNR
ncbi:MAG: hypothetical protein FJZ67_07450 [Bacteroidetes bacterium]|nr:hypothetical protein [Bacteroidota bacterium]